MSETSEELSRLAEEAARVRALRPGVRIQWSDDFRKKAAALVMQGITIKELAHAVKVGSGTVWEWCRRQGGPPGFAELKVVAPKGSQSSITVTTKRGHAMVLSPTLARQWLQEGIL